MSSRATRAGTRSPSPEGESFRWDAASTYIKNPPYFDGITMQVGNIDDVHGARVMGIFGDSITTDHISPAGNIKKESPAGRFLMERGVQPADFNSYGSRRGNDDVMVRGTFANIRIRNLMLGGEEGGNTIYSSVRTAPPRSCRLRRRMRYKADGVPLVFWPARNTAPVRHATWAAKGTNLLGVKAVVAESFERIHRSNLAAWACCRCASATAECAEARTRRIGNHRHSPASRDGASKTATVTARKHDGPRGAIRGQGCCC
jgi:aconitate hydratase